MDEAAAELRDIVTQFEALKSKKEQIEKVVEALRPFLALQAETPTLEAASVSFSAPAIEQAVPEEPVEFTFMKVSGPGMEVLANSEPAHVEDEQVPEPVHVLAEATEEQVAYFRQPSADPFQRRIDDALWGWQQRPEGLLSPI